MPGPRAVKSENGFFRCDTWLQIFQNDSKICEAEVTVTPLINKICNPCFAFAKDEDFHRWNEALNLQNHTGKLPVEFNQKYINKVIKEHNRWISEVGIFNNRQTGGRSEQVKFARELVVLVFSLLTVK